MYLIGLLVVIVGLVISVALHEFGHLFPAKRFGALVPEFWVGFGPTLWSKTIRGTTYGFKAVLLGGYVRILGMFPPASKKVMEKSPDEKLSLVEQVREQSAEEMASAKADGLRGKGFYQLTTGKKMVVMLGGPFMNLLICVVLTMIVVTGIGWREATTTIAQTVSTNAELGVDQEGASPAEEAGILAGDKIVQWNGVDVDSWEQLRALMAKTPSAGTTVEVERDGKPVKLFVTPVTDNAGNSVIGVIADQERVHGSVQDAGKQIWQMFTGTAAALATLPVKLWQLGAGLFGNAPRDASGAMSVVGVARIAGEITAADPNTGITFADRAAMLLSLLASLNMALFVFNLIPLPPLDGGHVLGAAWGGVKNTWARITGRPKPAPVDTAKMVPVSYAVFGILMVVTIILVAADFIKPLKLL